MRLVPALVVLMWAGLLWSRALLSVGVIAFIIVSISLAGREAVALLRRSVWIQGSMLLFFIPLVSGWWSEDMGEWKNMVQVKAPLLLLPLAIPVLGRLEKRTWHYLLGALCIMVLASSMYSYWHYFRVPDAAEAYLRSKVLPVAMYNDHVRYAWLLVIVYAWLLYTLFRDGLPARWKTFGIIFLIYLAIFIHVLAAKTGLLGFYLVNVLALIALVPGKWVVPGVAGTLLLPLLFWFVSPSFQNRLRFVFWDFQNYSRGLYVEGLSDAPRVLSMRAGADIMASHPIAGVGAGDVVGATKQWYADHAPYLKDYEKLLPSNEVLVYGCSAGVIAAIICLVVITMPFFSTLRRNMLWTGFHLVAFAGFMYEITLEVQFGVFIYVFFTAMFHAFLSGAAAASASRT